VIRLRVAAVTALASLIPAAASAQRLSGWAGGFNTLRRISYQSTIYEQTGVMFGGGGEAGVGPVILALDFVTGTLTSDDTLAAESKIRSTSVALLFAPTPWLRLGGKAEGRVFESDAGTVNWKMMGGNVRLAPSFGAGFSGLADLTYYASATPSSGPKIEMAVQATVAARYESRGPLQLQVGYRFERYDFATSANSTSPRLEQYQGIVAGAGVRFGRH
jgi:hypothetical protein